MEVPLDAYFHDAERIGRLIEAVGVRVPRRLAKVDPRLLLYRPFAGWLAAYVGDWRVGSDRHPPPGQADDMRGQRPSRKLDHKACP